MRRSRLLPTASPPASADEGEFRRFLRRQFDRFVADAIHLAVGNLRPDLRLLYYKPVSGTDAGNYIALFALTRESRDKYWPGGADSEVLESALRNATPIIESAPSVATTMPV